MNMPNKLMFAALSLLASGGVGRCAHRGSRKTTVEYFSDCDVFDFCGLHAGVLRCGRLSKNKSTKDYYTAGGGISGFQNGLAIAGDYMSAASFFGYFGYGVHHRL